MFMVFRGDEKVSTSVSENVPSLFLIEILMDVFTHFDKR
jgi:hypothetical protein